MTNNFEINSKKIKFNVSYHSKSFTHSQIITLKKWLAILIKSFESAVLQDCLKKKAKDKKISFSVIICGDQKMKRINYQYRSKNKSTDVLSFPMQENLRDGRFDLLGDILQLGDILISKDKCLSQANAFQLSFREEFVHLLTHGFLHLLGYDHEISLKEEKLMEHLELKILSDFKKRRSL